MQERAIRKLGARRGSTLRVFVRKRFLVHDDKPRRERADRLFPIRWMIGARCTDERQLIQSRPRNSGELCIPSLCHSHRHAVLPESTLMCSQGAAACAWRLGPHDVQQSCKLFVAETRRCRYIGHKHNGKPCIRVYAYIYQRKRSYKGVYLFAVFIR